MSLISRSIFSFDFSRNVIKSIFKAVLICALAQDLLNARLIVLAGPNQEFGVVLEQKIEQLRQVELDATLDQRLRQPLLFVKHDQTRGNVG